MGSIKYVVGEHPVTEVMEDTAHPVEGNPDYMVVNSIEKGLFVIFPSKAVDGDNFKRGTTVHMVQGNYDDFDGEISTLVNNASDMDEVSVMHVSSRMPIANVIWAISSPVK
ncbi:hypothetical protein ITP31_003944 [Salmonella enterica]|nr:hypothetical protein [Salmonella enterica]